MPRNDYISCLPPEILVHIFKHALPGPLFRDGRLHFQSIRSVCSDWRRSSFSSPILWSSVVVSHFQAGDILSAERWFARAGPSIPLELQVLGTSLSGMEIKHAALTSFVTRHQSRWKYLSIIGAGPILWDIFNQAQSSDWVNLRKLHVPTFELYDRLGGSGIGTLQRLTAIQSTPLQELRLYIVSPHTIAAPDIHFISTYIHLRTLLLNVPEGCMRASNSSALITLSCLEHLSITTPDLIILCHLDTPALSELTLHLMKSGREPQVDSLRDFLAQCRMLHSVNFCDMSDGKDMDWMLPTLSTNSRVTAVTVSPWPKPSHADETSQNTPWWDTWCPNLRSLTVGLRSRGSILKDEYEMKVLNSVKSVLRRRDDVGMTVLDSLVFRNSHGATDFPYNMFETLGVGKFDVMVPW
ncbi:hypothetical protein BKA70DRAFT_1332768 [Coprinopsis sp. MPI-PUGE-AT-0042]|nr:hypothetical protein BKA70DRAFT_1332768 [Coprinopsis sp. MPI-PUGE-AT-0042]